MSTFSVEAILLFSILRPIPVGVFSLKERICPSRSKLFPVKVGHGISRIVSIYLTSREVDTYLRWHLLNL